MLDHTTDFRLCHGLGGKSIGCRKLRLAGYINVDFTFVMILTLRSVCALFVKKKKCSKY